MLLWSISGIEYNAHVTGAIGVTQRVAKGMITLFFYISLNLYQQGAVWLILLWTEVEKTNYWYTISMPSYFLIPKSFEFWIYIVRQRVSIRRVCLMQRKDPAREENANHRLGGVFVVSQMVSLVSTYICKSKNAKLTETVMNTIHYHY